MGHRRAYLLPFVVALCLAAGVSAGGVSAAGVSAPRASAAGVSPPRGALVPLTGAGSCFGGSCPVLHGFGGLAHTQRQVGVSQLLFSGRTLQVIGSLRLAMLTRDPRTGALSQPPGGAGCLARAGAHVPGCGALPHLGDTALSRDGRTLWISHAFSVFGHGDSTWLRYSRDPRTGALRPSGKATDCDVVLQARCPSLRGLGGIGEILRTGDRALVLGGGGGGGAVAILTRTGSRWVQPRGESGCANRKGTDGCEAVKCMNVAPDVMTTTHGGRDLYVSPSYADAEQTYEGYVAAFATTGGGGLRSAGCRVTGSAGGDGLAPILLTTLPGTNTVVVLVDRGDEGDGRLFGRFYAAKTGADGALGKLQWLGHHNNQLFDDDDNEPNTAVVTPDRRYLYAVDVSGKLEAWRLTSTSVRRLPGRWGTASRPRDNTNLIADPYALLVSPDGRFLYVGFGSANTNLSRKPETLQVYRIAR